MFGAAWSAQLKYKKNRRFQRRFWSVSKPKRSFFWGSAKPRKSSKRRHRR